MALGFTQPLAERSTINRKIIFLGSRARPALWSENLNAICKPIDKKYGILDDSQPCRPPRPVAGRHFYLLFLNNWIKFLFIYVRANLTAQRPTAELGEQDERNNKILQSK
jgi:hypothetical protein